MQYVSSTEPDIQAPSFPTVKSRSIHAYAALNMIVVGCKFSICVPWRLIKTIQFRTNWSVNPQTGEYTASTRTPTGIPTDPPLAAKGIEQAKELAEHLCQIEPPVDRVYSSPFYRCLQTLKPTTERLFKEGRGGGKIRIDRGVGEFFGRANFEHPDPPTVAMLTSHFEDLDQEYQSVHIPAKKGEMIVELHERVNRAINRIITDLDNDPEQPKTVLICTHAATMIALGRVLTGNMPQDPDEDDFQCYTASLSKFVRKTAETESRVIGNWVCELNSETGYLSQGAERGWSFAEHRKDDPDFESSPSGWSLPKGVALQSFVYSMGETHNAASTVIQTS